MAGVTIQELGLRFVLSHNGCHGCTGSTELREAKQSKDHDRIQNDICDDTAKL